MAHSDIMEAAVITMPDATWQARPLLIAVKKKDCKSLNEEASLSWHQGKLPEWVHPDKVVFINELPHTATGQVIKSQL